LLGGTPALIGRADRRRPRPTHVRVLGLPAPLAYTGRGGDDPWTPLRSPDPRRSRPSPAPRAADRPKSASARRSAAAAAPSCRTAAATDGPLPRPLARDRPGAPGLLAHPARRAHRLADHARRGRPGAGVRERHPAPHPAPPDAADHRLDAGAVLLR